MGAWKDLLAGLDPDSQLPAVAERRTSVVSAGAGSGKTRVLAVRYLHLVKERGLRPERILCLTFTKKAAAEMNERIRGMLSACAADDPDFAVALAEFPKGRVSTLDSFCSEVARNSCARWGVAPDFAVDEQAAAKSLEAFAIQFLLERRDDSAAASFMAANGFEASVAALTGFAGGGRGLVAAPPLISPSEQRSRVADALTELDGRVRSLLGGADGLEAASSGAERWATLAAALAACPVPDADDPDSLRAAQTVYTSIAGARLATGKSPAAVYFNEAGKEAKPAAEAAGLACEALLDPLGARALGLLEEFARLAAERRAAAGVLAYADVASMALAALGDDLALRDWYKSRWDAVMIDEFQDDNELQKRLLYCVAERRDRRDPGRGPLVLPEDLEPGVLFFVGDEKQSIYGFRGADVTVFRGLSGELGRSPGGLGGHRLSINWRSEPTLIRFLNDTFSRVMPEPGDHGAMDYEARFEPLGAGQPTPGVEPAIVLMEYGDEASEGTASPDEAEAWAIAELVTSLVGGKVPVTGKADGRKAAAPCRYDDIAILFRSTGEQSRVERQLRLHGIPYTAASASGLFAESVAGDLYAALRAAAYPEDRLAFAAFLRGPLARMSDDSIFAALSASGLAAPWDYDGAVLPAGEAGRYATAKETWRRLGDDADRLPLVRLVEYLWYSRGLRWNVLRRKESTSYLEHFDFVWAMAGQADARGERLVDFVSDLEAVIGSMERVDDGPVPRESSRGVSVMTVHRSKGLEFPVVILPGMDGAGRNATSAPIENSERFGVSLRRLRADSTPGDPIALLSRAMDRMARGSGAEAMDQRLAETARLFYVACTRAISRLYMTGATPRGADPAGKSFRGLLLKAWPGLAPLNRSDEGFVPLDREAVPGAPSLSPIRPRTLAEYERLAASGADDGRAGAEAAAAAPIATTPGRRGRMAVTEAAERLWLASGRLSEPGAARLEPGGLSDADFGTLCHAAVETLLAEPGADPVARLPSETAAALGRLSASARADAVARAAEMARAFAASPRGMEAASARRAAEAGAREAVFELEYPFAWRSSGGAPVTLSGIMDLVYGGAAGVTVVDFKTDREFEPERHRFQLSVYRDAAESIFDVPAKAFVHYLRDGREAELSGEPDSEALSAASWGVAAWPPGLG